MSEAPKFASVVVYVDDVAGTVDFYRRAFGLSPEHYDEKLGFAELGPERAVAIASHDAGELMMPGAYPRPSDARRSGVEIALWSEDVAADYDRAVACGAKPLAAPREMPWGMTVAYVESIEGTVVGFVTPRGS